MALSGILYTALKTLFEMTRQAFLNLSVFLTSFLPVTASLYTMTGNTATAAAGTSMMLLFNTAVVALAERFLFPLLQVCFALSLVSAVPNGVSLQSIITLVKNTVTTLLAFAFTMFSAVLYFQTAITASADNLAYRSIRFASGVFIPVIGSVIGDASRTVNASIATVKSTVGYVGVAALAILLLPPIITACLLYTSCGRVGGGDQADAAVLGFGDGGRFALRQLVADDHFRRHRAGQQLDARRRRHIPHTFDERAHFVGQKQLAALVEMCIRDRPRPAAPRSRR